MVKYCNKCGGEINDYARYCPTCGVKYESFEENAPLSAKKPSIPSINNLEIDNSTQTIISEKQNISSKIEKPHNASTKRTINNNIDTKNDEIIEIEKKEDNVGKYILNPSQRYYFSHKVIPVLFLGSIIWLIGDLFFSMIFSEFNMVGTFRILYFTIVGIESMLLIRLFILAKKEENLYGLILLYVFSFLAGILGLPLSTMTYLAPVQSLIQSQVHMVVTLTMCACAIVFLMGSFLGDKFFEKGAFFQHFLIFIIASIISLVIFILVFNIHNFALSLPIAFGYICLVSLTILLYGSKVVKIIDDKDKWFLVTFRIFMIVVLSLIIAIIFIILALLFLALLSGGGDFGSSGGSIGSWSGSSSSSKKKKKKKNLEEREI